MKRLLAVLCALVLCLTMTSAQAKRSAYPTYDYKMCEGVRAILGSGYVCMKALITRQNDGIGFIVHDIRIYGDSPQSSDKCAIFENDPSILNYSTRIWAFPDDVPTTKWSATTPELQPSNDCYYKYTLADEPGQVVLVGSRRMNVRFDYMARMRGWNDQADEMFFNLVIQQGTENLVWSCNSVTPGEDAEICSRVAL